MNLRLCVHWCSTVDDARLPALIRRRRRWLAASDALAAANDVFAVDYRGVPAAAAGDGVPLAVEGLEPVVPGAAEEAIDAGTAD